jgi:hypothetical protein
MATIINTLVTKVVVDGANSIGKTREEFKKLEDSTKTIENAAFKLGGAIRTGMNIGAGVVAAFTVKMFNAVDSIQDLSRATGISAGQIRVFSTALEESGGKASDANTAITRFSTIVADAASGSTSARKTLESLNISLDDLRTKSEGELLTQAITNLGAMGTGAEATRLKVDLFGKSLAGIDGKNLSDMVNSGDMEKAQRQHEELANVVNFVKGTLENLEKALYNVYVGALEWIKPFTGEILEGAIAIETLEKAVKALAVAFALIAAASIVNAVTTLVGAFYALAAAKTAATLATGAYTKAVYGSIAAEAASAAKYAKYAGAYGATKDAIAATTPLLGKLAAAFVAVTTAVKAKSIALMRLLSLMGPAGWAILAGSVVAMGAAYLALRDNTNDAADAQERLNKALGEGVNQSSAETQRLLRSTTTTTTKTRTPSRTVSSSGGKDTPIEPMGPDKQQLLQLQDQLAQENEAKRQALMSWIKDKENLMKSESQLAIEKYNFEKAQLTNALESQLITQQQYDALFQSAAMEHSSRMLSMENQRYQESVRIQEEAAAKEKAIQDAKYRQYRASLDGFASLQNHHSKRAQAIGRAAARVQQAIAIKDALVSTYQGVAKSLGAAPFPFNLALAAGALAAGMAQVSAIRAQKFANGGTPPTDQISVVGERGPELFVPKSRGTVIPNEDLFAKSSEGSQPVVNNITNINVSAVDGQSVARFFKENSKQLITSIRETEKAMPR